MIYTRVRGGEVKKEMHIDRNVELQPPGIGTFLGGY
jgi:hypothetical protein